jgi:predicted HTH domain antitoxin
MKTVTLQVPDEADERRIKMAVAAVLFERAIFSSGQAAEFAGITKREFVEKVGSYGVSIFGETKDDLAKPLDG